MAQKMDQWDPEIQDYVKSRYEYEEYVVPCAEVDHGSPFADDERHVNKRFFVHVDSGLVTTDIEKFEQWFHG